MRVGIQFHLGRITKGVGYLKLGAKVRKAIFGEQIDLRSQHKTKSRASGYPSRGIVGFPILRPEVMARIRICGSKDRRSD